MAASQRVVTVDLGTSTIKVAEFGIGKGGTMTMLRFGLAELGLDPNKEEERGKFITPTLAKLFKENRIKAKEVLLSISGQSVFMKFVKLPPVDPAQVEQVVQFEAQQNVPFPIDEVTWDYQMMPTRGTGNEAEAVIVAIKKEVLEAEVEAVERVGVKVRQVDVAPFALLNAFRYSELQTDECSLIIDMGARSTNLVFVEKNSFWIRNVPIAGNQISQAICNEMQEPFTAAETLKKGKGFVSLGGVYADPDDADAARISKLAAALSRPLYRRQAESSRRLFQPAAQRKRRSLRAGGGIAAKQLLHRRARRPGAPPDGELSRRGDSGCAYTGRPLEQTP
jgi:type IV pilus assembly protein PilM